MLNRVIRLTEDGYELEANLRHAKLMVEQLGLEDSKPVTTAGVDMEVECAAWAEEPEGEELAPAEAKRYRAICAVQLLAAGSPRHKNAVNSVC